MELREQYQLDSLRRVQAVLDAHADVVGVINQSAGRKQLDAAVTSATAQLNQQGAVRLQLAGQKSSEHAVLQALKVQHMQPIAEFARAKLRGVPGYAALTPKLTGLRPKQLMQAGRAMATAAASHGDELTQAGFPADVVAQLSAAADAVDAAITQRAVSNGVRTGATKGLKQELKLGREAVAMMNPVVKRLFAGNDQLLAEWRAAKRVVLKPGVVSAAPSSVGPSASPAVPAATTPSQPAAASPAASQPSTSSTAVKSAA